MAQHTSIRRGWDALLNHDRRIFNLIYAFDGTTDEGPWGLLQHTNGTLYGTTDAGGTGGYGTVFSLDMGLGPFITFVIPFGQPGRRVQILGNALTGATAVSFNGLLALSFGVVSDTFMWAVVPKGSTSGPVQVTVPSGTLTSNVSLQISQ